VLPTLRRVSEPFRLCLRADDAWGNPSDRADAILHLRANGNIRNLPQTVASRRGAFGRVVEGLIVDEACDVSIDVLDGEGRLLARSNAMRVVADAELLPYWCDFHWQSRETVGMGTVREGLAFARDRAFIDVTSHAANDLQLGAGQWHDLNRAFAEFNESGRFVVLPGYEWSGNTPLGGDRNVIFLREGGKLRRSSHALVPDRSDLDTDCSDARDLFKALEAGGQDVLTFAHVGGRHCNIKHAHDPAIETAIEVHSTYWGTFEWLIRDAFEMGYRVGLVCNSDDHKGRPGASCVGFAEWGNGGGLTCLLARELSREGVWESLKKRRHYGTTGVRLHLQTNAKMMNGGRLQIAGEEKGGNRAAIMGDIATVKGDRAEFQVDVLSAIPIHRLEIRNGLKTVDVIHPYAEEELGDRFQITFEGAEFRGRMPATSWDGSALFSDARIRRVRPLNFALQQKGIEQTGPQSVKWWNITTGNVVGIEMILDNARAGTLSVTTPQGEEALSLADFGCKEVVFDYGMLGRRMRVFRLPDQNPHGTVSVTRHIALSKGDNPLYVVVTLEDCNQAFASPIYLVR
jgi:hypothetical protein